MPLLPANSSYLCCHERYWWGAKNWFCPREWKTLGTPMVSSEWLYVWVNVLMSSALDKPFTVHSSKHSSDFSRRPINSFSFDLTKMDFCRKGLACVLLVVAAEWLFCCPKLVIFCVTLNQPTASATTNDQNSTLSIFTYWQDGFQTKTLHAMWVTKLIASQSATGLSITRSATWSRHCERYVAKAIFSLQDAAKRNGTNALTDPCYQNLSRRNAYLLRDFHVKRFCSFYLRNWNVDAEWPIALTQLWSPSSEFRPKHNARINSTCSDHVGHIDKSWVLLTTSSILTCCWLELDIPAQIIRKMIYPGQIKQLALRHAELCLVSEESYIGNRRIPCKWGKLKTHWKNTLWIHATAKLNWECCSQSDQAHVFREPHWLFVKVSRCKRCPAGNFVKATWIYRCW